jgi:anti-sigma factor RsiW
MSFRDHIPFLRRRPSGPPAIPCQQVVELVTAYIEGTLDPRDHARLEGHLNGCDACIMYVEQMRATLQIVGHIEPEQVSPAAYDELSAVFVAWKAEH